MMAYLCMMGMGMDLHSMMVHLCCFSMGMGMGLLRMLARPSSCGHNRMHN